MQALLEAPGTHKTHENNYVAHCASTSKIAGWVIFPGNIKKLLLAGTFSYFWQCSCACLEGIYYEYAIISVCFWNCLAYCVDTVFSVCIRFNAAWEYIHVQDIPRGIGRDCSISLITERRQRNLYFHFLNPRQLHYEYLRGHSNRYGTKTSTEEVLTWLQRDKTNQYCPSISLECLQHCVLPIKCHSKNITKY